MPNYPVDAILYGNAMDDGANASGNVAVDWQRVAGSAFGRVILGEESYKAGANGGLYFNDALTTAQRQAIVLKALLYFDMWGKGTATGGIWHLGPGDVGGPTIVLNGASGPRCYRMTDRHMARFYGWIENWILAGLPVNGSGDVAVPLGAFLDDYGYDRAYWLGPAGEAVNHANTIAQKCLCFGSHDGRAGFSAAHVTQEVADWNKPRVDILSARLNTLILALAARPSIKRLLFNGTTPVLAAGQPRMWEGYQRWWTRAYIQANCRAGDTIVVMGRTLTSPAGALAWYTVNNNGAGTDDPEITYGGRAHGDSYADIMAEAAEDAVTYGLRVIVGANPASTTWKTVATAQQQAGGGTGMHNSFYTNLEDPAALPDG